MSSTDMNLLISAPIYQDENPLSYLMRLAQLNGYPSYNWLLPAQKEQMTGLAKLYQTLKASRWAQLDTLTDNTIQTYHLPALYLKSTELRYCPLCLKQHGYWKMAWQLKLATCCTEHQIWLHEKCPSCQQHLPIKNMKNHACCPHCDAELDVAALKQAPSTLLALQTFLVSGKVDECYTLFSPNTVAPIISRYQLLSMVMKWQAILPNKAKPTRASVQSINPLSEQSEHCAQILFGDKANFWRFMQKVHLGANNEEVVSQQKRLVAFYREFLKQLEEPSFAPLRQIIEEYASTNLIRDITAKHSLFNPEARNQQKWISFTKACQKYLVYPSQLNRLVIQGRVRVYYKKNSGYNQCSVLICDIEKIAPYLQDLVSAHEAAKILGMTKAQFHKIQNTGCFKFEIAPSPESGPTWQYSRQELQEMLQQLERSAAAITNTSLQLPAIAQFHLHDKIDMVFLQFFKAILSGTLPVRTTGDISTIRDLWIDLDEHKKWLASLMPTPEYMSITEAAAYLKVNEEFAYQLVNYGYLQYKLNDHNVRKIFPEHLDQFQNEYFILAKHVEEQGQSSWFIRRLEEHNIQPVDAEKDHKLRQRLYRRSELMSVRELNRLVK